MQHGRHEIAGPGPLHSTAFREQTSLGPDAGMKIGMNRLTLSYDFLDSTVP